MNSVKLDRISMANAISSIPLSAKKRDARTGNHAKKCTQLQFVNSTRKANAPEKPASLSTHLEVIKARVKVPDTVDAVAVEMATRTVVVAAAVTTKNGWTQWRQHCQVSWKLSRN